MEHSSRQQVLSKAIGAAVSAAPYPKHHGDEHVDVNPALRSPEE
jgi:hypothetical protein